MAKDLKTSPLLEGLVDPACFVSDCAEFLDKMKQPSAYPLVRKIKSFITEFLGNMEPAEEQSEMVRLFLKETLASMFEHPLWRDESRESQDKASEALERYLMYKVYKVAFYIPSTNDLELDAKFYHRTRLLRFLQPHHLDIPSSEDVFEMAVAELSQLDNEQLKAPRERVTFILNSVKILTNIIRQNTQNPPGADDILPYLIFTLIRAAPKHIHSNIRIAAMPTSFQTWHILKECVARCWWFIQRFRSHSKLQGEPAYFLTQLESAVVFVEGADHSSLSITPEDFARGMEEAGSQLLRERESPLLKPPSRSVSRGSSSSGLAAFSLSVPDMAGMGGDSLNESSSNDLSVTSDDLLSFEPQPPPLVKQRDPWVLFDGASTLSPSLLNEDDTPTTPRLVNTKYLHVDFESLTVADLKELLKDYKTLAQSVQQWRTTLS